MTRRSRLGMGLILAAGLFLLSGCVPADADVVGQWTNPDGAALDFADDGTFSANGVGSVLTFAFLGEVDVPDDLSGTWYVESPFENPCDVGDAIKVSWRTEPVQHATAFCLRGRGSDAVLSVPVHDADGAQTFVDFARP